jgi:hypothetical protein
MAKLSQPSKDKISTLLIVSGVVMLCFISFEIGVNQIPPPLPVSEQAVSDAERLTTWIQTGTNITVQNVTHDKLMEIWHEYIFTDTHVNICQSAFEFTVFGFNYDGLSPLIIYRAGVKFLTQSLNGQAYELEFGRVVSW